VVAQGHRGWATSAAAAAARTAAVAATANGDDAAATAAATAAAAARSKGRRTQLEARCATVASRGRFACGAAREARAAAQIPEASAGVEGQVAADAAGSW